MSKGKKWEHREWKRDWNAPFGEPEDYWRQQDYARLYLTEDADAFLDYGSMLKYSYNTSVCQEDPERCDPRPIKLVVWDADDTMWDVEPFGIAGSTSAPYVKINSRKLATDVEGRFKEGDKEVIQCRSAIILKPSFLETLDELEKHDIKSAVASANPIGKVAEILTALGLADKFIEIESSYRPKSEMIKTYSRKHNIPENQILFVDDSIYEVHEVGAHTAAMPLMMESDVYSPQEILDFIEGV